MKKIRLTAVVCISVIMFCNSGAYTEASAETIASGSVKAEEHVADEVLKDIDGTGKDFDVDEVISTIDSMIEDGGGNAEEKAKGFLDRFGDNPLIRFLKWLISVFSGLIKKVFEMADKAIKIGE